MKMYVAGKWVDSPEMAEIKFPFSNELVDTVRLTLGQAIIKYLQVQYVERYDENRQSQRLHY